MRGRLRWFLVLGAFFALAGNARAQGSEPLTVERGPGAEDCPDAASLAARIASIRGRAGAASSANYAVAFTHTPDTYTAVIHSGANGESQRVLEGHGPGCAALAQASAVTLALLFASEPDSAAPPIPEPPQPPPPPPPPPKVENPLTEPVEPEKRSRLQVDNTLELGASALIGVLRPVSPAFSGELGLHVARIRVGLGVLWNPTQSIALEPGTVHESLLSGTARTCFALLRADSLRFDVCSGLMAGVVSAQADGFTVNERRSRSWLAVPVELSLAELSGPVGWELSASALGALAHRDFQVDGLGVAYRSPRVGAMLSLRAIGLLSW